MLRASHPYLLALGRQSPRIAHVGSTNTWQRNGDRLLFRCVTQKNADVLNCYYSEHMIGDTLFDRTIRSCAIVWRRQRQPYDKLTATSLSSGMRCCLYMTWTNLGYLLSIFRSRY